MNKKIDDILAEEGTAAEHYDGEDTMPKGVAITRPNIGRPTVVSVRLSANEHARLQQAAEEANLSISTLIRIWALDRLHAEEEEHDGLSVVERLRRLEHVVFQQSM